MAKQVVELEQMSEEQLKRLQAFLRTCVSDAEVEEGWREGVSDETLPLIRGLLRHISTEYIGEAPENEFEYDLDNEHDSGDELDF